jgi:hypothetical protein
MAHVKMTIGIGRAVMEYEQRPVFGLFAQFVIDLFFIPLFELFRFSLGQIWPSWQTGFQAG